MKTVNEKLQEIFRLSLKIDNSTFYHQKTAESGNVYTFEKGVEGYKINVEFRYSEWVDKKNPESLDNAIKSLNNIILNQ